MKSVVLHFLVAANLTQFPYPLVSRNESCEDEYHGVKVSDPYQWLENLDSPATQDFISAQNRFTDAVLESIPKRGEFRKSYMKLANQFTNGIPIHIGDRYFYKENSAIYVKENLSADPEILFDPLTADETLGDFTFSGNGEILAYSLSKYGSDWKTIQFRKVANRQSLPDILRYTKWPDLAWSHDNSGIFYNRFPIVNGEPSSCNNKVYYHRLNTKQEEDILIAEFPASPHWSLSVEVSHCGKYLLLSAFENFMSNAVYIASLEGVRIRKGFQRGIIPLFSAVDEADYTYVSNVNSTFYFITNKNADNGRLMSVDVAKRFTAATDEKQRESRMHDFIMKEVIPQSKNQILEWAHMLKNEVFIVCYLQDVKTTLELIHTGTMTRETLFPLDNVKITQSSVSSHLSTEFFFRIESFINPGTVYRCEEDFGEFSCSVHSQDEITNFSLEEFSVKQVWYQSKDKTAVPMFIVHKKNFKMDGTAPAILSGYGGFKFNSLPEFSLRRLFFIQQFNGIYVVANIRGGGEFGKKWHEEGSRFKKQNTFDDFIAAAEYLIRRKYTTAGQLAIEGSSNGGLLVAACINQRPQLFGAAIVEVGVLDMLRFHNFTGGYAWCSDYGCSQNFKDFQNLLGFSPLHNIKRQGNESFQYPAVMVITGKNDDRVVPSHSYKYIAELQYSIGRSPGQRNPLLLRVNTKAGHDSRTVDDEVDTLAFLMETMGLEYGVTASPRSQPPEQQAKNAEKSSSDSPSAFYLTISVNLVFLLIYFSFLSRIRYLN